MGLSLSCLSFSLSLCTSRRLECLSFLSFPVSLSLSLCTSRRFPKPTIGMPQRSTIREPFLPAFDDSQSPFSQYIRLRFCPCLGSKPFLPSKPSKPSKPFHRIPFDFEMLGSWFTKRIMLGPGSDAFERIGQQDDEDELKWDAIERLPTYERSKKEMLEQVTADNGGILNLGPQDKKQIIESVLKVVEEDNESFLRRLRERIDRVGIEIPKIEVRYKNLSIEGDVFVGSRALPNLLNATLNAIEGFLQAIRLFPSNKKVLNILQDVSGIVRPSRYVSSSENTFIRTKNRRTLQ